MQFHSQEGARRYQDTLVPLMFAPSARKLVASARLSAGAHVLDIATGTGIVARTAAEAAQLHRYERDGKLNLHFAAIFYTAVPE